MADDPKGNGWDEWKRYVLGELKRVSDEQTDMRKENVAQHVAILSSISDLKSDLSALKVKAGVWGLIGGAIPVSIGLLIWVFESVLRSGIH